MSQWIKTSVRFQKRMENGTTKKVTELYLVDALSFAEAEAILIKHAVVVPLGLSGGYQATKLNPFESQYAPFGVSTLRYKGQHILETAMNTEMFNSELAKWEEARANAAQ